MVNFAVTGIFMFFRYLRLKAVRRWTYISWQQGGHMINADELAEKLKVSRRQVQLLAERREIPFYRVGSRSLRFDETEVMKAIKRTPAKSEETRR